MSAANSDEAMDAVSNSQAGGEGFSASRPKDEPLMTGGHQPGRLNSEENGAPEFHAQTLPAGTAPEEHTFKPDNLEETSPTGAKPE